MSLTDARDFFVSQYRELDALATSWGQHGHDFALTRNHHGAGFWDRGYGEAGTRLSDAEQAYGEHSVITDDDGTVENV